MKTRWIWAALLVAGCGGPGMQYVADNYSGVVPQPFDHGGDTWQVFDKPHMDRLMITPSTERAFAVGLTFGATAPGEALYSAAAQAYLDASGRSCTVESASEVITVQYEVIYACR